MMFSGLDSDIYFTRVLPEYDKIFSGYKVYTHGTPFEMKYGGVIPELNIAYETWGELNEKRDNAVFIATGLSSSSHAKSHEGNPCPGWWEKFVGPGCAVDTNKYFVICTNNLGGCYGTTGPSSVNPNTGKPYGAAFPIVSVEDMARCNMLVVDSLGIHRLHASVGSSLGGMCSLMSAVLFPDRVGRLISVSACAQPEPTLIGFSYLQRKCIMSDPNWNRGHYYGANYPKTGLKLAREIAMMTYRSGLEWDERFGRSRIKPDDPPSLGPIFQIESYLEHHGEKFSTKFDPNSLLSLSKAIELFDIAEGYSSLEESLSRVKCPALVIGVRTDILFPIRQQRKLAKMLQESGNNSVTFYELSSIFGHDTFLLDLNGVGTAVKGFLETELKDGDIGQESCQEKIG